MFLKYKYKQAINDIKGTHDSTFSAEIEAAETLLGQGLITDFFKRQKYFLGPGDMKVGGSVVGLLIKACLVVQSTIFIRPIYYQSISSIYTV